MTLEKKRNHYNIKFLKGYGHSISVKDSKIILKNCADPFSPPDIEEWHVNRMPYSKIVLSGKGYVSTEAMSILSENNRHVILVDAYGKLQTVIEPVMSSLTASKYRIAQYDAFRDKSKRKYLALQTISAKIDSQINFLKSTKVDVDFVKLQEYRKSLTEDNISKIEAVSSQIYFREYSKLIDNRFEFKSRNAPLRIKKDRATDVINALLNYGYSVLAGEISKFIHGVGLDPYYGFMHKNHTSFQSLVYDMMEPFRWLVECAVWRISEAKSVHRISKKQYSHTREGYVVLEYDLIRVFLEILERVFQSKREIQYKFGQARENGMTRCQEITIVKIEVEKLIKNCIQIF